MTRFLPTRLGKVCLALTAWLILGLVVAPASFAAPALSVSATEGLTDGQTITVDGSGFAPNLKGIAVGQCRTGYVGPADCNLSGGATFRNADASGSIATVTLKLAVTFGDVDCLKEQCIMAAAPLPTTSGPEEVAANTVEVPLYFGDAAPAAAPAAPAAPPAAAPAVLTPAAGDQDGSSTPLVLTSAAPADNSVLYVLIATNLLLAGAGLFLGLTRPGQFRRRAVTR
ncbi:neocarzinostatin apoprotein domain-containing protein [Nocardioides sp.]|uniref:neocarzinostatin apoprotein domain-containing protein n=1 Tax=Nocardioides sp. TaxID=35761 RepID=UPI003566BB81